MPRANASRPSVGSSPVSDDFYTALQSLEVEENADAPDALLRVGPYAARCDEIAAAGYEGFALA